MYCKIIKDVCREPLGEIQFEKKCRQNKTESLGGVEIFQGSVENPLIMERVVLRPLKGIVKIFWQGLPKTS
jgi:hypothetical protein